MKVWFVGPKRVYTLTEEDKLWLARACAGECGEKFDGPDCYAAVCWSMMNRYLLATVQDNWQTFTQLLRAFCQPINPKWARGGAKCPTESYDKSDPCYVGKLDRRARMASLPWEKIDLNIRNLVESFAAGNILIPDKVLELPAWRISNWAAYRVDSSKRAGDDINIGDNWFFEDGGEHPLLKLMPYEVHVVRSDEEPEPSAFPASKGQGGWTTMNTLAVVLGLGAAGIAAYLLWARSHY
jgi:hypothetical protein